MTYAEFRKEKVYLPIDSGEEMLSLKNALCDFFWVDCPKEKIDGLGIVPNHDPVSGMFGYTIFRDESGVEVSVNLQVSLSKKAVEIGYRDRELFNDAFSKAWDSGKTLYIHDDPLRRLCGFVVEGRDNKEWHYIPLTLYKS